MVCNWAMTLSLLPTSLKFSVRVALNCVQLSLSQRVFPFFVEYIVLSKGVCSAFEKRQYVEGSCCWGIIGSL